MEPDSTGMPINQPISEGFQACTPLSTRKVISTPFIIQAAKQTVNANVLIARIHHPVRSSAGVRS